MTLDEEKKLVWEWLGKKPPKKPDSFAYAKYVVRSMTWSPHKDRNCWPEIWGKMDLDFVKKYLKNLHDIYLHKDDRTQFVLEWNAHTAPPEVCWKALVKTLG